MPNPFAQFRSAKWPVALPAKSVPPLAVAVAVPAEEVPAVVPIATAWEPAPAATPVAEEPEIAALSQEDRSFFLDYLKEGNPWIDMKSTNVRAIKYSYDDHTLDAEYNAMRPQEKSRFYTYYEVPVEFFCRFVQASSKGKFVWNEIRRPDAFDYTRYGF